MCLFLLSSNLFFCRLSFFVPSEIFPWSTWVFLAPRNKKDKPQPTLLFCIHEKKSNTDSPSTCRALVPSTTTRPWPPLTTLGYRAHCGVHRRTQSLHTNTSGHSVGHPHRPGGNRPDSLPELWFFVEQAGKLAAAVDAYRHAIQQNEDFGKAWASRSSRWDHPSR